MKKLSLFLLIILAVCINTVALTVEKQTLDTNVSYMGGYPDGTFKPDGSVTRAEAVTVFSRLAFPDGVEEGESRFEDVKGHWSEDYISSLEKLGILDRYDGKFYPDKPITRAELVEIAVALLKPERVSVVKFDDVDATHPFYEAISLSAESGLVGGYPDKTFRPDNTITRAETVTIINRAVGISVDGNVFGQNYSRLARFTDISGHWARYNILVASNSCIGEYLLPSLDGAYSGGISEEDGTIILQNDFVECIIESGYIVSLYDKTARRELLSEPQPFAYIVRNGVAVYPDKIELSGSKIIFTLDDGTRFSVITTVKKAYISFEIADFKAYADMLVFANVTLSSNGSVLGISTNSLAITHNAPKSTTLNYSAMALSDFGINGASYAFVVTPSKYHLTALEVLAKDCDIKKGIFAASRFDTEEKRLVNTNYYLGMSADHETLFSSLELFKDVGIDMLSFHKGGDTFRQGDFVFTNQSLKHSYEKVIYGYLDKHGLSNTQPYSYYFSSESKGLFADEFYREFERVAEVTLEERLGASTREITLSDKKINGDLYIAIDDELISADFENGRASLVRGEAGTEKSEHMKGAVAVVIDITGTGVHNFKALVSEPLRENGILSGLHTYAFYIDPECEDILSDPRWQNQFKIREEYTLAEDINAYTRRLTTVESLENAERVFNFRSTASELVLIGEELIKIDVTAIGDKTFSSITRGYHNTIATEHSSGEKIRRIEAYYGGLTPKMGSELFYHIARLTGETYRDGGFDMVYFDAIDGVYRHIGEEKYSEYYAYYTTEFMRETLEWCGEDPITEVYLPMQYVTHSYTPAYDYANRGYKEYIKAHSEYNQAYLDSYFLATLGWYNFFPQSSPANTVYEHQHTDDIDLLGCTAVAYDYSMVFSNLDTYKSVQKNRDNIDRYVIYDKLRKSGYFSEEVRQELRESEWEHTLVEKDGGGYGLVERYYVKGRINDLSDPERNAIKGENPFAEQTPFIRIEADFSGKGDSPVTLLEGGSAKKRSVTFDTPLNAEGRQALYVKVTSKGHDGYVCISLESPIVSDHNQIDYVIPTSFEGEKEFVLVATDTFLYPMEYFPHWAQRETYNFKLYRGPVDFSAISSVKVYTQGDVSGVTLGEVCLTRHINSPIKNPSVTFDNGSSVAFDCVINSGEWLEYDGNRAVLYTVNGKPTEVGVISGKPVVSNGEFTAVLSSSDQSSTIMRGKLTVGFSGKDITK